jgi:integrase/recombinase XerD
MHKNVLEQLKSIKLKRSKEPFRPVRRIEDLLKIIDISSQISKSQTSHELNQIILQSVFYTGLRISELISLKLEHVDLDHSRILVLHGKHGKSRWLGINRELKPNLERYISSVRPETNLPYLFVLPNGCKMSRDRLEKRIKSLSNRAGFPGGLHQWRRACLTYYAGKGVPVPHLKILAGHASIITTQSYIRPDVEEVIANQVNW